jgi:hypothetical protein
MSLKIFNLISLKAGSNEICLPLLAAGSMLSKMTKTITGIPLEEEPREIGVQHESADSEASDRFDSQSGPS